eukprot:3554872-Amphidinium_carterae.1
MLLACSNNGGSARTVSNQALELGNSSVRGLQLTEGSGSLRIVRLTPHSDMQPKWKMISPKI